MFSIFSERGGRQPRARPYLGMAADRRSETLQDAQDQFVAVWGQMATAWGISRTMAEVHALLYITGQPMNTDEIMERLQISRGNASMSLRALLDWGIVQRTHKRGDRKEYFAAEQDVWGMFRAIVRERMKREIDPLLASLYEIRDLTGVEAVKGKPTVEDKQAILEHNKRLEAMVEFFQVLEKLSQRFVSPSGRGLQAAASVLNKIVG
jgi:HTH-type transcriptional regulator, glycine betaine synthesis regulator